MTLKRSISLVLAFVMTVAHGETIEEKLRAQSENPSSEEATFGPILSETNRQLSSLRATLREKYAKVNGLSADDSEAHAELLAEVNDLRIAIREKESSFKDLAVNQAKAEEEGYGLWDQEETTVSQLVMEYGASDFLYIVPPDIANSKLSLHSSIPIPRESWKDLLEVLLAQSGIGIKEVNAYTRQLYQFKQDLMAVHAITASTTQLDRLPDNSRLIYVFSPDIEHLKSSYHFFERFRDPKLTFIYTIGNKIAIVAVKEEVQKLLNLYDTVWERGNEKVTKVIGLTRISAKEMQKILKSFFGALSDGNRFTMSKGGNELSVHPLEGENGVVLIGTKDIVNRAQDVIDETQKQLDDPCEMTVYWYNCRYSDCIDLADVLERVYGSLICANVEGEKIPPPTTEVFYPPPPPDYYQPPEPGVPNPFASPDVNPVNPPSAQPGLISEQAQKSKTTHFIPYPKTGALMMVVRKDTLDKILELIRKLDIPKKMVQIEVLLCEKRMNSQTNSGLNLLKMGSAASGTHATSITYDGQSTAPVKGLFQFLISRKKYNRRVPAYDLAYNFLLSQEDIHVNASPSVMTVNQTPATISVVEEISINNGAAPIETNSNITFEKSFVRQQFGITLVMTPTIHEADLDDPEGKHSVTLETNVTFDTPRSSVDDRPKVNRRHIQNQVRIVDGQTIVLGGLRRKTSDDKTEKLPFLGEIPGIAKLFGTSVMTDQTTEMFIFITPHIIVDPAENLERIQREELMRRPGDIPEFLERIQEAKNQKKRAVFEQSFKLIFGNLNAH
ncbi:MAG: type II secretion system protein GspD [Simkaniaceae bacterium]|nr:type II secretion system protein GspD [Simkaniaceae bacterium]